MTAITTAIFDLDGTLVQTEVLKAESYARAAAELTPHGMREQDVMAVYNEYVGRGRDEVATALLDRFGLEDAARARMAALGVETPVEAYVAIRLRIYESMISDTTLLRKQQYPEAIALLRKLKAERYPVGIATMSHLRQARIIMEILDLRRDVDVLVARDEVKRPKPAPDIYLITAARLHAAAHECFVLEDSLPGVMAANAAGMMCVAFTNELTRDAIHAAHVLPPERIVDDHARLESVVLPLLGEPHRALA